MPSLEGGCLTSLTVYDGGHGIGGNKIYLEEDGSGVFLDFGKNFSKYSAFYEEFLRSRDARGIHDLIYLNLLPRLNIYREDLLPADVNIHTYPSLGVAAVLVTHAHFDHCGNIGMLRSDIPMVASPESLVMMKGMQDTGHQSLEMEMVYVSPRGMSDDHGLCLGSQRNACYRGRDICCAGELSDELISYLSRRPGQESARAKRLEPGRCQSVDEAELPFDVSAHPVDHSVPGATAYILRGDTTVAYTGDFRLHGRNREMTLEFVRAARDASVLITEGTRIRENGGEGVVTEQTVAEACLDAVERSSGLVIADFSPRNFERLESFQEIARKTGRELVVTAKDAYLMHALQSIGSFSMDSSLRIYKEISSARGKWREEVVDKNYSSRYVDHLSIRENPEAYILCFSFLDMKNLLDIKPDGGTYIYSACEAFNEEMEIDFHRLWRWLQHFSMISVGFGIDGDGTLHFDGRYHASGHASGDEIRRIVETVDPEHIVPVHTQHLEWFEKNFDNVVSLEEGRPYEF
ncbi:MAG: MBL fold metallo-hydrolase [Methanothrix sp.]|uniref:MBL fold metallo-hydrolase n=1 Tax=Methanothrix sp. TaxID=90426 RepID=UPI0032AFB773|nr:MBL fold metallo-hydrolase [Methanothrix sp.]